MIFLFSTGEVCLRALLIRRQSADHRSPRPVPLLSLHSLITMDSKAEKLAAEYEQGEIDPTKNNGGKRTKSEQVDHKHTHPEGDTRKMVQMAMNGEQKRREHTK
ncbi:hypothetical protein QR680_012656 [Steinernema hermaphroditum]|uniref:Uncharacterized protein n=1 Tax=Steinernema hermaphroditum TaxID=289476 RepID=A0AA39I4R9_9BILA|nr:hypothetical protein QR680_012656 [Steinernema hermaphroditum]